MKKVLFFVAALLTLTFTACEDPADVPACYKVIISTNIPELNEGLYPEYVWTTENQLKLDIDSYKDHPDYAALKEQYPDMIYSVSYSKSQESDKASCEANDPSL